MNVLSSKLFAFVHHIGSHGILGARYEGGTLMENIVLENENPSSSRYNWHLEENLGKPSFKKSFSRKSYLIFRNPFEAIFGSKMVDPSNRGWIPKVKMSITRSPTCGILE